MFPDQVFGGNLNSLKLAILMVPSVSMKRVRWPSRIPSTSPPVSLFLNVALAPVNTSTPAHMLR